MTSIDKDADAHAEGAQWHDVTRIDAIEDPGTVGFTLTLDGFAFLGFVVRKEGGLYAYENFCPHAGRNLNWGPDRFLTSDQSQIMCAAHGALFEIESGMCVGGPCVGEQLRALPVRERDGIVQVQRARRAAFTPRYPGS